MPYTDIAKDQMLDAVCRGETPPDPIGEASLHSGFPGTTGANEISGGAPAYARQTITFDEASGGSSNSSVAPVFDVPASTTIQFVGYWSSPGSPDEFLAFSPVGNTIIIQDSLVDVTNDEIDAVAHGFIDDDQIVFLDGTPPGGLSEGTLYWVISAAADLFQVSATQGGGAITLTNQGDASVEIHKVVPETFGSQGTFTLSDADLNLNG